MVQGYGRARVYSDLNIALQQENGQRLKFELMNKLMEEFDESDLPYKVDVIGYNAASGIFKQNVSQKIKETD